MISFHVPAMSSRQSARAISARICDVAGVRTLEVDLVSRTVRVDGAADAAQVRAAITAAGYAADTCPPCTSVPQQPRQGAHP